MSIVIALGLLCSLVVILVVFRCYVVILDVKRIQSNGTILHDPKRQLVKTLIVAGSGGHTAEMMRLVGALSKRYNPRHYIVANTDVMSETKVRAMEESKKSFEHSMFTVEHIVRSREVRQSWLSTIWTTLKACLAAVPMVWRQMPDMVLVNGPGTCIPICASAFLLTVLGVKKVAIVFVESICRVNSLSLTGRILYYFADQVLVQWPELKEKYPRVRYLGDRLT